MAEQPRAPVLGAAAKQEKLKQGRYLDEQKRWERRSVLRGLILVAVLILLLSWFRGGLDRAFFPGWWRQW